jgi:hypothetical protein
MVPQLLVNLAFCQPVMDWGPHDRQHNGTQHNDTTHNYKNCDAQHNETQHNALDAVMLSVVYAECLIFYCYMIVITLSVIMLCAWRRLGCYNIISICHLINMHQKVLLT